MPASKRFSILKSYQYILVSDLHCIFKIANNNNTCSSQLRMYILLLFHRWMFLTFTATSSGSSGQVTSDIAAKV